MTQDNTESKPAVRERDVQLRNAIESIRDGFALYDADERLIFCNNQYRDFYPSIADMLKPGARLEDLTRAAYEADAIRGPAEKLEERIEQHLTRYRAAEGSHEQQLKDGRWLLCSDRRTSNGDLACIRTDITERKRAEDALRETLAWLEEAQRVGQVGHWVWDEIEDRHLFVSQEHRRIFGKEGKSELHTWKEFLEIIHPDDRERTDREQTEASETGTSYESEYRIILPNGETRVIMERGEPVFDDTGRLTQTVGTVQDITEQKRAEEALRDAHDNLEQRVEERTSELNQEIQQRIKAEEASKKSQERQKRQTDQIKFLQDLTRIANEAKTLRQGMEATLSRVCDYTGWDLGHGYLPEGEDLSILLSTGIWVVKGPDQERFAPFVERTRGGFLRIGEGLIDTILEDGEPVVIADVSRREDFSRREVAVACGLHGGFGLAIMAGDQVVGVLEFYSTHKGLPPEDVQTSLVDIGIQLGRVAERTRLSDRLGRTAHVAQQASRAKSEFLATMSHELRTPLTSIKGSLGLLNSLASDDLDSQGTELLEMAMRNSDAMLVLINELLDYEKILSGSIVIETSTHNISALTSKVVNDSQGYAKTHSVDFVYMEPMKPAFANVQEHRFEQVLRNLLSNAAKFSEPGSTVKISLLKDKGTVSVRVKDNGPGIPEEYRKEIFEQFSQIDSSSTREKAGTGLGLPISKALTEGMGGTLDFETEVGVGSTFCISFAEAGDQSDET